MISYLDKFILTSCLLPPEDTVFPDVHGAIAVAFKYFCC